MGLNKRSILAGLLLCVSAFCFSQKTAPINSIDQLTDSISAIVSQEHIVGLMLGITTTDSVLFSGGFGFADLENKRKVNERTLFRMGSITKMFVSLGIMRLVNEGKLTLNDELKKVAPEVPFHNKWEDKYPVRIVHLLEHTTGFDDVKLNRMYSLDEKENDGREMMMEQANSMVCRWKPGERFAYSNPNYDILGYVIEKTSGMPYEKYLTDNILDPLGMISSNFDLRSRHPAEDSREYVIKDGQAIQVPSVTLLSGPQGALWSNADDMLLFLKLFLRNGSPLFSTGTIKEMETPHSSLAARFGLKSGYGLGNDNSFFANFTFPFKGHEGITGTCFSTCKYNRDLGVGFVIASNSNQDNHRIETLIVEYLERDHTAKKMETQKLDETAILPFLGRYQFESPRNEISAFEDKLLNSPSIFLEGGKMYFRPLLGNAAELVQTAPMTFAWKGDNMPMICFTKNDAGKKVMLVAGSYYELTSNAWVLIKRAMIVVALLFALSSIFSGVVALLRVCTGKTNWKDSILLITPMIGLIGLTLAVSVLLDVQQYTYKLSLLRNINSKTLTIFTGTLLFGLTSITSLLSSIFLYPKRANRFQANYLLLSSLSHSLILAILWWNEWIGLRTWAM